MSATTGDSAARTTLAVSLGQKTIPSLDGLRAVAVTLVICHHLGVPYAPHGRGVLTFFVLSGFLITWLMLKESERYGGISIRDFYVRRVLRIFPAFYVYIAVLLLAHLVTRHLPPPGVMLDYLSAIFYAGNYRFAITRQHYSFITHTWALSIEEQFYLIWPCLFALLQFDLRKMTRWLIAAIVFVDLYRMVLFFKFHVSDSWLTLTFDSRVDHLLVGCLLAVLLKRGVLTRFWNLLTARTWRSLVPFGLIILSIGLAFRYQQPYKYAAGFVVDPVLTAIFLVQTIAMGRTWLWGWLNWRAVRYLGQISYGMFLYHMLAERLVTILFRTPSLWIRVPAVIACAAVLGAVSFHLIERRFLRLKSKFTGDPAKRAAPAMSPGYQVARG